MDDNVTVLSMNVRGLFSNSKKRADVFDWAKSKDASIVCFQETHSNKNIEKYWEDEWGNKCVFSHHDSKSAGGCVMFKKGLDFVIHNSEIDRNGHYIILDIGIHTQRLTFVCLYGYNTDEPSLFNIILQKVLTFSNTVFYHVVIGMLF
jgi:exonuclease III